MLYAVFIAGIEKDKRKTLQRRGLNDFKSAD